MSNPYLTNNLAGGVTTLATGIDNATLTIVVASAVAASIPASCAGTRIRIGDELITLASRATNTLTAATRGVEGTAAAAHNQNDAVSVFATAGAFDDWIASGSIAGLGIGVAASLNRPVNISIARNAASGILLTNTSNGSGAFTNLNFINDAANGVSFGLTGSGYTPYGMLGANTVAIYTDQNVMIGVDSATSDIIFSAGVGLPEVMRIKGTGHIKFTNVPTSSGAVSSGEMYSNTGVLTLKP